MAKEAIARLATAALFSVGATQVGVQPAEGIGFVPDTSTHTSVARSADNPLPQQSVVFRRGSGDTSGMRTPRKLLGTPYFSNVSDVTANRQGVRQKGYLQLKVR